MTEVVGKLMAPESDAGLLSAPAAGVADAKVGFDVWMLPTIRATFGNRRLIFSMFVEVTAGRVGRAPSAIRDEIEAGIEVGTIPASISESMEAGMPDGEAGRRPEGISLPKGRVLLKRGRLYMEASPMKAAEVVGNTPVGTPVPLSGSGGCGRAQATEVRSMTVTEKRLKDTITKCVA